MFQFSQFNILAKQDNTVYIFNTMTNVIACIPKSSYNALDTAMKSSSSILPEEFNVFIESKIITENNTTDLSHVLERKVCKTDQDDVLSLMIHPTLQCNINCSYCYQAKVQKETMSFSIIDQIIEYIEDFNLSYDLKDLNIVWSGGEPTLAYALIKSIIQKINCLLPGISLRMKLITNGTLLTDNLIKELISLNVRNLQISIDGLFQQHNDRRSIDNYDAFASLMQNIDNILINYPLLYLTLRVNIDKNNIDNFSDIFQYLTEKYPKKNWILFPDFVYNYNTETSSTIMSRKEKASYLLNLIEKGFFNPEYLFHTEVGFCMNKSKNSFAIAPDGRIYKCEAKVGLKEYSVAHISDYMTVSPSLSLSSKNEYPLDKCLKCPLLPICNYGCPNYSGDARCHLIKGYEEDFFSAYLGLQNNKNKELEI